MMNKSLSRAIGLTVFGLAVAAIWTWPKGGEAPAAEDVVRPVRYQTVKAGYTYPDMQFPGVVKAGTSRTLAFEVPGRLLKLYVKKAQMVKKGDLIAKLDPKDFEDELVKAKTALERDQLTLKRVRAAAKRNAVSAEEVSSAEARVKTDETECATAQRALEHTTLLAPFDGFIADTYPDDLDMLTIGQRVVTLLNTDTIEVEVSMPETLVIRSGQIEAATNSCYVSFDSYPVNCYPVRMVKFTSIADPRTQVYKVTFAMPEVKELTLLPGMSATVTLKAGRYDFKDARQGEAKIAIPASAVGVEHDGRYYVWKLKPAEGDAKDVFVVNKAMIAAGCRVGTDIVALEGVSVGERIVTAGVSQLAEGRKVTLLEEAEE